MMLTSILISFPPNIIINLLQKIIDIKTENLFGAQFGKLEKMYINLHKKHLHEDLALTDCALLIICYIV